MVLTNYDWFCLALGIVGTLLCVYSFYLNGWSFEETMFRHTSDDE